MKRYNTLRYAVMSAFLLCSTFLLAHTVNALIENAIQFVPRAPQFPTEERAQLESAAPREDTVRAILRSRLFPLPANVDADTGMAAAAPPPPPPLNLASKLLLRGTAQGHGRAASAFLEELSSKKQALYHLGDQIEGAGELIDVQRTGITIRQGKQEEFLPVHIADGPGAPPIALPVAARAPQGDPKRRLVLDRREVDAAVSNLSKLMAEARATPYFVDGKVTGFQIIPLTTDSFFSRIGLVSGDILKRINGADVRDPGQVLTLFQQVKNERIVKVDIVRQEQPTTLVYEIR